MSWQEAVIGLTPRFLLRLFSGPYIAGNSVHTAIQTADNLWKKKGISSTLDLLGEGIHSKRDAEYELSEYLQMLDAIGERSYVTISLKPTQLGLAFDRQFCKKNLETLLERTEEKGIRVTIDMEESDYTDATLRLYKTLRASHKLVGTVLQSRLLRTSGDVDEYLNGIQAHIRLCLGIYNEPAKIAYQKKSEMKENFIRLAKKLWANGHFVAIATHDEELLRRCLLLAKELKIPSSQYEVQMLLGVPREEMHKEVLEQQIPVRLYVPYGTTWDHAYAYAKRRLVENPNIGFYIVQNVLRRVWDKIFSKKEQIPKQNP